MKKTLLSGFIAAALTIPTAFAADKSLQTIEQQASYSLGVDLAKTFEKQGVEIDVNALMLGMEDVMQKNNIRLTQEQMQQAVKNVKEKVLKKQIQARKLQGEKNAKKSEAFLAENKKKDGVKVTKSGLQYKVLQPGQGKSPTETDYLTAHYKGTLTNGKVFDSSYDRGTPIEFQIGDVIAGWGEALKLMKPGSKWEIYVPPALAYGSKGAGNVIGPNETLIFTIELIAVSDQKPDTKKPLN